jgi:hypothetical protein
MRPTFEPCEPRRLCAGDLIPPTQTVIPVEALWVTFASADDDCDCGVAISLGPVIPAPPPPPAYAQNPTPAVTLDAVLSAICEELGGWYTNWTTGATAPTAPPR